MIPTITDIDVIARGHAVHADKTRDYSQQKSYDEVIAKLNTFTDDHVRTAYFQQIVRDIGVAENMERGDWADWLIGTHPKLVDEDMFDFDSRENANYHTLNQIIKEFEDKEAKLIVIDQDCTEPQADADVEKWKVYAHGLKRELAAAQEKLALIAE
jgi:hypothetical protein